MSDHPATGYRLPLVARGYDLLNAVLWLPAGSDRLRRRFVHALDLTPGCRVLELGCGTGAATRHLVATGAAVTALDSSPAMLARARRRAPSATFVENDVVALSGALDPVEARFDRAVFAFVLHELDRRRRAEALGAAANLLAPGGRIGILEWALPESPRAARIWRTTIRAIEPPIALEILDGGLEHALAAARLSILDDHREAGGRARILIAEPA